MPGWQKIYDELKGKGFEIISAAQDTGGEPAAGKYFDDAKATFTQIVDVNHTISSLYSMVNVPTGVWIDEKGRIVRPNEVAYSSDVALLSIKVNGGDYVGGLRDWVDKGDKSIFAMKPEEVAKRLKPPSKDEALADASFKLGVHFHQAGNEDLANKYWEAAEKLRPDSWNYHRQDWSFTPQEAGRNWMAKYQALQGKPYYTPLDLPKPTPP